MVEETIARQDDMAVVARCASFDQLLDVASDVQPDIVVAGLEDAALPRACLQLMVEQPGVSVIGVEASTSRMWRYELRLEQVEIDEVAPTDVVTSIRDAARRHMPA
jgi:chemotaxis response regulator CheB